MDSCIIADAPSCSALTDEVQGAIKGFRVGSDDLGRITSLTFKYANDCESSQLYVTDKTEYLYYV